MNNNELRMLRKLFFLEVTEAAKYIGEVEPRTWQRWEDGTRKIPGDVINTMQMICLTRTDLLAVEFESSNAAYIYFDQLEEHEKALGVSSVIKWRVAQSIASQLTMEKYAKIWQQEEMV